MIDKENPENIMKIYSLFKTDIQLDVRDQVATTRRFGITAIDRNNNESDLVMLQQ